MKLRFLFIALFFLMYSCATTKTESNTPVSETPPDYSTQIELAKSVGSNLYILDKASAIGTDVLFANVSNHTEKNLAGYITFREADDGGTPLDSYLVSFYTNEDPPKIKYDIHVRMNNKHEFIEHNPSIETKLWIRDFIKARQAAIKAIPKVTQPINPVIMPGEIFGKKGIALYLLAGTNKPDLAVLGKHYRAFVDPEKDYAVEIEPLSKSEIEMPLKTENNAKIEALMVTQLLTDWPTEIHVFASLLYKMKVYVSTKSGIWSVDGTEINFIEKFPEKGAQ
jgi:hypothetical protein